MWLRKARARLIGWQSSTEEDVLEGTHDGYRRLTDPVTHRRRIMLDKRLRRLIVDDWLDMQSAHDVELHFHCNEASRLAQHTEGTLIELEDVAVRIQLPEATGARVQVCRGQMSPPLGWVSRRFDVRVPAPTLVWRARLCGPTALRTVIQC
jgi:hypothetical protein